MSLDRAIQAGKEHRQPYRRSKAWDPSCRNHGGCPYCESGRLRHRRLSRQLAAYELALYWSGEEEGARYHDPATCRCEACKSYRELEESL